MPGDLTGLLNPESVAIVGASDTATRIGGRALAYMLQRPFAGRLYPVNPSRDQVQGRAAYASITALPETPDVALLALPDRLIPDAVEQLIARGARNAVIFSSGFAETGAEGAALQDRILIRARAGGLRLLGPNSLGVLNTRNNFWGTFSATLEDGFPPPGRVAIASQSGAFGAQLLCAATTRNLGISVFVATGNEADISTADAIDWLAQDDGTDVILSYVEGIRDGDAMVAALERARAARKPVFMLKAGRSALGAHAAQSHTAALAGNDAVTDAILRDCGAIRITSAQEGLDFAETAARRIYPVENSLGVLTVSGGAGIMIADDAEALSLPMPPLPDAAQARLKGLLSFAATRNPVDCTAQALNETHLVGDFGTEMMQAGGYAAFIAYFAHAGGPASLVPRLRVELRRIAAAAPDRLMVVCVLAAPEVVQAYRDDGYVVFDDAARAVAAVAAMGRIGRAFAARPAAAPALPLPVIPPDETPDEAGAKALLSGAGIAVAEERTVISADEAAKAAHAIGFPVVMKILSPDILHKTEIGGVLTGIASAEAAAAAFATLTARAAKARPDARITGVLVARQITGGTECLMGIQRDPVFGPVAVFGLGGIHVEVLKDVTLRRCPFDEEAAAGMIAAIRSHALLRGVRGQPGVDLPALAKMLSHLSHLAMALGPRLVSIDLNPVIATPDGAWAVDAVIEMAPPDAPG
ncbi:MAG: acetate--CoA ligase family protein [Paracoccus denitrificans]|uniref:Acetate--CoA ligase family protein n=1 Tax=Paracoccus denitrificans TaxID=266 RepID=A0A533I3Y2_PARDE|nr:MAG: acetate--CoA ligase family protein [Paracoccus denitrificans]